MSLDLSRKIQAPEVRLSPSVAMHHPLESTPKVMTMPKAEINFDADRMRQSIKDSVSKLNEMMDAGGRGLSFALDEKLGQAIIYVKNSQTGEVVRQIPNEVVVRIAHGIEDLKGLLHNESI